MTKTWKILAATAALAAFAPMPSGFAQAKKASPAADDSRIVNPPCPAGQKGNPRFPDMKLWDAVLKEHVRRGIVDYRAIQKDERFRKFMAQWDCMDMDAVGKLPDKARTAFWINLHNAYVVALVVQHYPVSSPLDIENFFTRRSARTGGHLASLSNLREEAERLPEPRVGFALCAGMLGSPPLRPEAYVAERLNEQLEEQTRNFLNSPRNVFVDHRRSHMRLSEVIRSHQHQIERQYPSVFLFLANYLSEADAKAAVSGKFTYQFTLDTDLNGEGAY